MPRKAYKILEMVILFAIVIAFSSSPMNVMMAMIAMKAMDGPLNHYLCSFKVKA